MRTPLRAVVLGATIVTGLGVVYSLVGAISGWEPAAGPLLQALLHLAAGALVVTAAAQGRGAAAGPPGSASAPEPSGSHCSSSPS